MIPHFPKFKPLELGDRVAIEAASQGLAPYSDFNFTNLYSWDTHGTMQISQLHGNVVIQFLDYLSETPFFTFLGHNRLAETANSLLALAASRFKVAVLRYVPEEVAQTLDTHCFDVTADPSASDYVYSVNHLANMHNWQGKRKRSSSRIRQFTECHPSYEIRHQLLAHIPAQQYQSFHITWAHRKGITNPDASNEYRAFKRFLQLPSQTEVVSLFVGDQLVGFSSFELVRENMALIHFSKTDATVHPGVSDVLYWNEAKILQTKGIQHYNWEQDLGIPGLQQFKMKFEPCHFLKKFTVSIPHGYG